MNDSGTFPPEYWPDLGVHPAAWDQIQAFRWESWAVTIGFQAVGGRMEAVGILIQQMEAAPGQAGQAEEETEILTAAKVRTLPFGELVRKARANLATGYHRTAEIIERQGAPEIARTYEEIARSFETRPGRPPRLSVEHYREVARVWTESRIDGDSPTKDVALHFHVARPTAARWVHECRKRGLLPTTVKGRAGGVLPPQQEKEGE